jgi:hypothetical protein
MLWEALAGAHPFRQGGVHETSRRIRAGAPPIEEVRPDLPPPLRRAVDSALDPDPALRPAAAALAADLRSPGKRRKAKVEEAERSTAEVTRSLALRGLPAATCGLAAGWTASTLPFYPAHWPLGIAAAAAALGFAAPRLGLAFALGTAFFPLANISLGLAAAYAVLAVAWLALAWNDARSGLLVVAGPLLAPLGIGLVPLVAQVARGPVRRGVQAAGAVLLAVLLAGYRHGRLPFDGSTPPLGLGIAGSDHPTAVAYALWHELVAHPAVLGEAAAFAAVAVAFPYVRGRGPWAAAGFAAGFLAVTALLAPAAPVAALVVGAWLIAAALIVEPTL